MAICFGGKPCRYDDCCHFIADCIPQDYKEHEYCGKCKHAFVNKPKGFWEKLFEPKPKECIDRFDNIHQPIG